MPKHPDAVGYLIDLANEVNEPWFRMVCDLVVVSGVSTLGEQTRDTLIALYTKTESYLGVKPAETAAAVSVPDAPADFLEQLSSFQRFKRLGDALEVHLNKRVTLIFGANGSGKSSLCEALKVLATREPPNRPLQNVRAAGAANPEFRYKFRSDAVPQAWSPAVGYGPRRTTVKYFDTSIAIGNVKNAVEPGRVIVLTPFRLHIFEWAQAMTTKLREALQREQRENSAKLTQAWEEVRADFAMFKGRPLSVINDRTVAVLPAQIKLGDEFADQNLLNEKQVAANELERAMSEGGLRLLRAEHSELERFLTSLNTLLTSAVAVWALEPASKTKAIAARRVAQEVLAKSLVPRDGTLDALLALLRAASPLCKMNDAAGQACPLCRQELGVPEVDLFKRYHGLLMGKLEESISALKGDIDKATVLATAVVNVDRKAWDKYTTIQMDVLTATKTGSDLIVANCEVFKEPAPEAKAVLESLKTSAAAWGAQLESKKKAIDAAAKGREELVKQLAKLHGEIEPLEYAQAIARRMEKLKEAERIVATAAFWNSTLSAFTPLLKKITNKAKEAHEELVVVDFEAHLNAEYKALTEKDMAAFGVILARKGTDAAVKVLPQVGDNDIEGVLCEGEQRVHALALFFAELETCPHSVLVFDDPISSFDYNYIANYCTRLRDLTLQHPVRQIIVFTHNWEFFVQLQSTLNQAQLGAHLSVQVLENCACVTDYSEKAEDLKKDIGNVLDASGEPTKAQKEDVAGKMRRLIEAVVNTHVFNHQRHQYKQKSQPISDFQSFTRIVPLLPAEATMLRDLYAKLSITEHDDPRNAYVNTDKAMFQTRNTQILGIETAVKARKP